MSATTAVPEETGTLDDGSTVAELLDSPRWHLAATLAERVAGWRAHGSPRGPVDGALATRRLERWKTQSAFAKNPGLWEERLASAGISEEELLYLLGESVEQIRAYTSEPAWLSVIAAAYGDGGRSEEFAWPPNADLQRCRFLPFVEPLVRHFASRLEEEAGRILAAHPGAPFSPAIARFLTAHLPDHFAMMLNRALLVEMHALKLEERLEGETPEARFEDFLEKLRSKRYALEILERFPVLARQVVLRLELWRNACSELLQHLATDAGALAAQFNGGQPLGRLRDVYGALSDFHRDGRSVLVVVFDSGFEVVYKPKSLELEVVFQKLLGWLNERGFEPAFRQLGVLDRLEYGWMEMVHAAPCPDEGALQRFLERQGGYLALLYVLDGTDFHHENLLAAGEHPMLIDLETLFQPWLNTRNLYDVEGTPGAPIRSTVLRTNMLPERWWGDRNNAGVDLSGLTAREGQLTPRPMLTSTDGGRDTMRMERRRLVIPAGENRVRVTDREVQPTEFAGPIEEGFRRLYTLLEENRDALAARLEAFAGREMRILFRNTAHYGAALFESFHPHSLGNALDRDRLFDGLWAFAVRRPFLRELAAAEAEDLHRGDIPLFLTWPDSRDVVHWRGGLVAGLFADSGLTRVQEKIAGLSPSDLERQVAVIRDSFEAIRITGPGVPRPSYAFAPRTTRPEAEEFMALARQAGDRIVERAFTNRLEALWLTLDYREPNGWQLVPSGPDFYLGLPGIALFLGCLGAATGEERYTEIACKALFAQKQQIDADPKLVNGIGGFNGWGGIIYTLAHLGRLWNDAALLDEAESYARRLPKLIEQDDLLDLIVGSAGTICSLAALAEARPSEWLDRLMLACGERLLQKAEPQQRGLGWRMPLAGDRALAGISHGAAGIALALLRLYGRTGDERFRDAASGGIEFERSLFSEAEQNWPDLRARGEDGVDGAYGSHYMWAWCHGAPGIGLARIAGLPWLDDAEVRAEIDVAVRSTIARGFGENHTLCHGDVGNVELLFAAARAAGDAGLEQQAWRVAGGIADSIRNHGWLYGLPGSIETPGLMAGLAGAGFGLARLARPDLFPGLLTLDP
ncbi:MAG TPA: type 2 lanthipeptide synthetase LanM family protein [Thermoanaerobaculia bacterium]|nr:type 2 lanthipeptide synthetase LanM family protein [Thermoanaerobaculia bacterium]